MSDRFFDFQSVKRVRIGSGGRGAIVAVTATAVSFVDEAGRPQVIDLAECGRIYACLRRAGAFPPAEDFDWGALADATADFSTLPLSGQSVVGLRGALDEPPWFQWLDRRRTQFEFEDTDHIRSVLLDPLAKTRWFTWDAC
jgi:hypothetical protein